MNIKHDTEFQINFLVNLLKAPKLGREFIDQKRMESTTFIKPWLQTIWGATSEHYKKYREWPSIALLTQTLNSLYDDQNLIATERELVENFINLMLTDTKLNPMYYKVEGERFLETRKAKKIIQTALDEAQQENDIPLDKLIEDLSELHRRARGQRTQGIDPFESLLFSTSGSCVQTGFRDLDARLPGGGHMEKRIMLCVGFTSGGKSTMLRTIEINAAMNNKKTLVVTLEDNAAEVAEKLYANASGIPVKLLQHPDYRKPELLKRLEEMKESLKGRIKIIDPYDPDINEYTNTKATTPENIENMIESAFDEGFEPDLITIDYLNRVGLEKEDSRMDESQRLRNISQLLKDGIAKKFKKPLITCCQANSDGFGQAIMQLVHMARSKEAAWAFDVIVCLGKAQLLNQTNEKDQEDKKKDQREEGAEAEQQAILAALTLTNDDLLKGKFSLKKVSLNIAKVRGGETGIIPIFADFSHGRFVQPKATVNTIKGMRSVDELVAEQTQELNELIKHSQ